MPLDLSPKPILLRMPDECKRYIAKPWYSDLPIALVVCAFTMVILISDGVKATGFEIWHLALLPLGGLVWLHRYRNPWHCRIDKTGIFSLIEPSKSSWRGTHLLWQECVILDMAESDWQGLPALTLRLGERIDAPITYRSDVQLIYQPNDEYTVCDHVIPAIEYYRQLHGHEEWIKDHGWEVYAKPSKVLADA